MNDGTALVIGRTAAASALLLAALYGISCGSSDDTGVPASSGGGGTSGAGGGGADAGGTGGAGGSVGQPHDAGPIPQGGLTLWTQPISRKVQPSTAVGTSGDVVVEALRDSYAAYEVVVHADGSDVTGVELECTDLTDGAGHTLAASNVVLFREYHVNLSRADGLTGNEPVPGESPTGDGRIPDPLIPFVDPYDGKALGAPFVVPKGENQVVWVDIHVPKATPAGEYVGALKVRAGTTQVGEVPVTVIVRDVVLPDMRSVRTHFPMRVGELIRYHRDIYHCDGDNCYLEW